MSDDAYPDFGSASNADPAALALVPGEGAWHPAQRPDSHARHARTISTASELEFYDRFPHPTPEKPRPQPHAESMEDVQEDDGERAESPSRKQSITVQTNIRQTSEVITPEQMSHLPNTESDAEGPMSRRGSTQQPVLDSDDEPLTAIDQIEAETPIFRQGDSAPAQEMQLETDMPGSPHDHMLIGTPGMQTPVATDLNFETELGKSQQRLQEAALEYEHQGEVTAMEEAVDEAPSAPLLDDPEAPPTVQDARQDATMKVIGDDLVLDDFDGAAAPGQPTPKSRTHIGQIERSFTTNFTELPKTEAREKGHEIKTSVDAGWPAAGDDKTFGDLLDDEHSTPVQTTSADPFPPVDPISKPSYDACGSTANDDAFDFLGEQDENTTAESQQSKGHRRKDTWGGLGSDETFGELVGASSLTTEEPSLSSTIPVATAEEAPTMAAPATALADQADDDMAAAFAAALGDDDLLDEAALDPSSFFGDDDDGFLDDELLSDSVPAPPLQNVQQASKELQRNASSYVPQTAQQSVPRAPQANPYAAAPLQLSQSHGRSAGTPTTGLYDVYNQGAPIQQPQQPPQRPSAQSAQSFVDKAKGGYQSPYDLPMDVVKQPRQRPRQAPSTSQAAPTPPPRSSSMSSQTEHPPLARPPTAGSQPVSLTPPSSSGSVPAPPPNTAMGSAVAPKSTPKTSNASGFFEDLPMAAKPRARPSGAYTPQPQAGMPQQQPLRSQAPSVQPPQRPQAPPTPAQQPYPGLSQPERLPLLPDQPTAPTPIQTPSAPHVNQRYSPNSLPAPSQTQIRFSPAPPSGQAPPPASRYSPAPAAQAAAKKYGPAPTASTPATHPGIQHSHSHAFAPRTSSPLAYHEKPQAHDIARSAPSLPSSPPKSSGGRASPAIMSPERATSLSYSPIDQRGQGANITSPPQRPLTQSPPAVMKVSRYAAQGPTDQTTVAGIQTSTLPPGTGPNRTSFLPHRRQFSRDLNFVPPSDQHAQDPLQRWKGQPIFHWGDSGAVITSFPKQTPFYAAGHGLPSIKCTPGCINVEQATTFMPIDEINAKFPGPLPLKAKKKKDVAAWMATKIAALEQQAQHIRMDFQTEPLLKKRTEEKLTLWKIMKVFVEHDGKLEGDKKIEDELRAVLLPNLSQMGQVAELQSPIATMKGADALQADSVDKAVVFQLRQALLEGQRERAVWLAEEKKMWGHAMLIASTLGPEIWKQVIQSFVRSQVKTVGSDARSLAALYQVFAGNAEECVDELVPPSAREGRQMVSKTGSAIASNPLEGLDQWQETLGMIAGNRTPTDVHSLLALGKLLAGYDRAEAAHSCFLFARQLARHTGNDDSEATFVLIGANGSELGHDLDAVILTEIYEWASSLSIQRPEYIAHLQSWKLVHAQQLAASGLKSQASNYCDHITTAYQSTTKPSPYYHPTFTQTVADLSAFLSQTPQTDGKGLLSKGAMNKVTSKTSSWFTKFVSGDDDQDSNASGGGPGSEVFGMVNAESPDLSRRGSGEGLYSAMMGGNAVPSYGQPAMSTPFQQQPFAPSSAPSKYAPSAGAVNGGKYAPLAAGNMGMPAGEPQRASSERRYAPAPSPRPSSGGLDVARPEANRAVSDYGVPYMSDSRRGSAQYSTGSYEPRPALAEQSRANTYQTIAPQQSVAPAVQGFDSPVPAFEGGTGSNLDDTIQDPEDGGYQSQSNVESYQPSPSVGYEPPSSGYGYEPPSYQHYEPEPDAEETEQKPRRKMMEDDDDDDLVARAAAVKSSTPATNTSANQSSAMSKSEADRIAEEAFRKAAEADAARDSAPKEGKKGWFGGVGLGGGGWFGGKKDTSMPQSAPNKPIKAKLGEENSFYFDKNLGKWVNKKDPQSAQTAAAATPPPPKGGASRVASAAMGPPSGPPSRVGSGVGLASAAPPRPPSISGSPQLGQGPPSGPPSRIGTPAGGSDSGAMAMNPAIAALNGTGPPSKPPSRPPTSMSNASSLDDLLGEPTARKAGGTVKSKKKGGRYVDVMQAK
ncbi:COPII coat assembly protein SEC16 [Pseudocercospora fuligena]|uniref:Protein transport protein sec16 n=1 Tax=Pseudocercospora fuligena TaxID=685502 RepID=A0A8H6RI88_9PEZI|nr:COPII coat assembly protein SEC16 [Pseudocercospora fuligena]